MEELYRGLRVCDRLARLSAGTLIFRTASLVFRDFAQRTGQARPHHASAEASVCGSFVTGPPAAASGKHSTSAASRGPPAKYSSIHATSRHQRQAAANVLRLCEKPLEQRRSPSIRSARMSTWKMPRWRDFGWRSGFAS